MTLNIIYQGDSLEVLKTLPDENIDCCVTSPPYWGLRNYGVDSQLGLEKTPEEYVAKMVEVFREVKRILKKEGTLWLNLGDSYAGNRENATGSATAVCGNTKLDICAKFNKVVNGLKPKNLVGIPWRTAFALQADGWYLRQDIIWAKPNPMPESVTDRCTKAHEYIFLLAKSQKYYFDNEKIRETCISGNGKEQGIAKGKRFGGQGNAKGSVSGFGERMLKNNPNGRNKRSVWTIPTKPYKGAHFATFPEALITPCILAGCPRGGIVLDPFMGSGTTCAVAKRLERNYIGIELNPAYIKLAEERIAKERTLFNDHHS